MRFAKSKLFMDLTFCRHYVYDQVVPGSFKSAFIIRCNLQHTRGKV